MLNYIWGILILFGIGFGLIFGKADALSNGVICKYYDVGNYGNVDGNYGNSRESGSIKWSDQ